MMLQGVPSLLGNSSDGRATTAAQAHESGSCGGELGGGVGSTSGGFSEEERGRIEEGERNSGGGNRWPRQETLALLKIRSDMDMAFRDSSLKGPLWDEVSRKLAELGYHRNAKKCKEKFENVYKYHKRTKEGRTSKPDGKTYRFFEQLEALETHPPPPPPPPPLPLPTPPPPRVKPMVPLQPMQINSTTNPQVTTVPSTILTPIITMSQNIVTPTALNPTNPPMVSAPGSATAPPPQPTVTTANHLSVPFSHPNTSASLVLNSTSSSTSSDEEPPERRRKRKRKRKRKWKDFFGRLMKEVMDKQEELQTKFLDTLEKRERERMMREEAWRVQEMAKMNRDHDLLVQERSIASAKDAAVISFLQKIAEQQHNAQNPNAAAAQMPIQVQENPLPPAPPLPVLQPPPSILQPPPPQLPVAPIPIPIPVPATKTSMKSVDITKMDNGGGGGGGGGESILSPSPSRWPKAEVQSLIRLRTTLDMKYQENGPKGPLWEEISASMRKIGYNRNAKRCKEKWENINKYYKKVKESSKKRPEDSKTCPYFHQLDAIYRERAKTTDVSSLNQMAPIMARPEQQWPLLPQEQQQQQQQQLHAESAMDDHESENIDQNQDDDDFDEDEDEDEEDEGGGYEIVTNKPSSMAGTE